MDHHRSYGFGRPGTRSKSVPYPIPYGTDRSNGLPQYQPTQKSAGSWNTRADELARRMRSARASEGTSHPKRSSRNYYHGNDEMVNQMIIPMSSVIPGSMEFIPHPQSYVSQLTALEHHNTVIDHGTSYHLIYPQHSGETQYLFRADQGSTYSHGFESINGPQLSCQEEEISVAEDGMIDHMLVPAVSAQLSPLPYSGIGGDPLPPPADLSIPPFQTWDMEESKVRVDQIHKIPHAPPYHGWESSHGSRAGSKTRGVDVSSSSKSQTRNISKDHPSQNVSSRPSKEINAVELPPIDDRLLIQEIQPYIYDDIQDTTTQSSARIVEYNGIAIQTQSPSEVSQVLQNVSETQQNPSTQHTDTRYDVGIQFLGSHYSGSGEVWIGDSNVVMLSQNISHISHEKSINRPSPNTTPCQDAGGFQGTVNSASYHSSCINYDHINAHSFCEKDLNSENYIYPLEDASTNKIETVGSPDASQQNPTSLDCGPSASCDASLNMQHSQNTTDDLVSAPFESPRSRTQRKKKKSGSPKRLIRNRSFSPKPAKPEDIGNDPRTCKNLSIAELDSFRGLTYQLSNPSPRQCRVTDDIDNINAQDKERERLAEKRMKQVESYLLYGSEETKELHTVRKKGFVEEQDQLIRESVKRVRSTTPSHCAQALYINSFHTSSPTSPKTARPPAAVGQRRSFMDTSMRPKSAGTRLRPSNKDLAIWAAKNNNNCHDIPMLDNGPGVEYNLKYALEDSFQTLLPKPKKNLDNKKKAPKVIQKMLKMAVDCSDPTKFLKDIEEWGKKDIPIKDKTYNLQKKIIDITDDTRKKMETPNEKKYELYWLRSPPNKSLSGFLPFTIRRPRYEHRGTNYAVTSMHMSCL